MKSVSSCWPLLPVLFGLAFASLAAELAAQSPPPPIPRRIPPAGMRLSDSQRDQVASLRSRSAELRQKLQPLTPGPLVADVEVLLKAVDYAVLHNEFYRAADLTAAAKLLQLARQRLQQLRQGQAPWTAERGLVVRGYRSAVDGSPQPYGLQIPAKLDLQRPARLYVWLHGRGDKTTDLHFITQRLTRPGKIAPDNAIVLHPFGRQCVGYKSAGETDVLDAIAHVRAHYLIDPDRIVLMGFSMGGAGAWHLGAHYADRFVAVAPGAGFAETARYNRLAPDQYPNSIEQQLWGQYDVPAYVRNLFNTRVVAYSGELDKQIQAARVMEQAYQQHGRTLPHLIGPGMGHKYHPETLQTLLQQMTAAADRGRSQLPQEVWLQTRTLRYSQMHWVAVERLQQHWQDSWVHARLTGTRHVHVETHNVRQLRLRPWLPMHGATLDIDGQTLQVTTAAADGSARLTRSPAGWEETPAPPRVGKRPGLQGPIDDAFKAPFLVVTGSQPSPNPQVQQWVEFELQHLQQRWRALLRGDVRIKRDVDVTPDDLRRFHLVLWGDPASNPLVRRVLEARQGPPILWNRQQLVVDGREYASEDCLPMLIFPNPLAPDRYVVLNSGPTFREAHDRTNSLQNPKLGDWAVIDLSQHPDAQAPGKVLQHGFFDENWQFPAPSAAN